MGPGTGFGLSALAGGTWRGLLVTEGGHIAFAPTDHVERQVLHLLSERHGRVSIERILAGAGMAALHAALEEIGGRKLSGLDAAGITKAAAAGDKDGEATVNRFCAILGSVAGDLALALGRTRRRLHRRRHRAAFAEGAGGRPVPRTFRSQGPFLALHAGDPPPASSPPRTRHCAEMPMSWCGWKPSSKASKATAPSSDQAGAKKAPDRNFHSRHKQNPR